MDGTADVKQDCVSSFDEASAFAEATADKTCSLVAAFARGACWQTPGRILFSNTVRRQLRAYRPQNE
jgi:hypothetical protein